MRTRALFTVSLFALPGLGLLMPRCGLAQIRLEPDGTGRTYEVIEKQFGRNCYEVPDCGHGEFGRHITEVFDPELNKPVFVFHIHAKSDDDRCRVFDRQRNEIKGADPSPAGLQHHAGEKVYARWKFRLDKDFVPSSRFTHLMQIKPFDGDADLPIITLTARGGNPEKMEVNHSSGSGEGSQGKIATANLADFKGSWVEVAIEFTNGEGNSGSFAIEITKVNTGQKLLSVKRQQIDMWRSGTTFNRLKWGVYRGLHDALRDEEVRLADFCVSEGKDTCEPGAPSGPDPVMEAAPLEEERQSLRMLPCFPNPSSTVLYVQYLLRKPAPVRLTLTDAGGRSGATLVDRFHAAGEYNYVLDTERVPPGVHLITLSNGERIVIERFVKY